MRVLEVITGGEPGGAQRHVAELSRYLKAKDHEVMVVHGGGSWLTKTLGPEIATRYVASLVRAVKPTKDIAALHRLQRVMTEYHPHVVHLHSSKAGILGRWAAWRNGIPSVYTAHGYVFEDPTLSNVMRGIYRRLESFAAAHSAATIVVSRRDFTFAAAHTKNHQAHYISNGVAPVGSGVRRIHVPPVVGFMGRFSREKGLDWIVPAASQHPEYVWRFAGDGTLRSGLVDATRTHSHLQWDGWVDDLDAWFAEVDVLIQPSWKEGAPYTLLDGLVRGVPAVGSRVGGIPEILEPIDPALVIRPGQPDQLVTAIQHALDHRDRLEAPIRRHIEQHFNRDTQLQKVANLLEEVARP